MQKSLFKYLVIAGIILGNFSFVTIYAQQDDDLDFDEVKVVAPFEPSIPEAYKILDSPVIEDTIKVKKDFVYTIRPLRLETSFDIEPISPARMRGEPIRKLFSNYAKGGFGSHSSPYFEFFHNSLRSSEYSYGARVKHISSEGGIDDRPYSGFSDNLVEIFGKKFIGDHVLKGDIEYNRNVVHFYGIDMDREIFDDNENFPDREDIKQRYNLFAFNTGFKNNELDPLELSYDLDLGYHYLMDDYDASQNRINFSGNINRQIEPDTLSFSDDQFFNLGVNADYFNNKSPIDTSSASIFGLRPTMNSSYRDFEFYLGFNAAVKSSQNSYFRIHPLAGVQANLIEDVLAAYGQLSGGIDRHNLYDFYKENPFINTSINEYRFKNKRSELRGGFKGAISSYISYNVSISESKINNYAFFATDTIREEDNTLALDNKLTVVYDDVELFNFRVEILSQIGERLHVLFASNYNRFTLDNEESPWHTPSTRLDLSVNYNIQNKIIFSVDAFARNSLYGRAFDEDENIKIREIHGFHVDANFGIEYMYTRNISAFLQFNNVQSQPLERWLNYPTQKFNFLGGFTYSF